jgi:hypothetical protein
VGGFGAARDVRKGKRVGGLVWRRDAWRGKGGSQRRQRHGSHVGPMSVGAVSMTGVNRGRARASAVVGEKMWPVWPRSGPQAQRCFPVNSNFQTTSNLQRFKTFLLLLKKFQTKYGL